MARLVCLQWQLKFELLFFNPLFHHVIIPSEVRVPFTNNFEPLKQHLAYRLSIVNFLATFRQLFKDRAFDYKAIIGEKGLFTTF